MTNYPEHEKLETIQETSQAIGEFLDFGRYVLAEYQEIDGFSEPQLLPVTTPINDILATHFGIDLDTLEQEKRTMLDALREANS